MIARFSLAALLAVVVTMSRPVATGGHHDLMAVGVRVQTGDTTTLHLAVPTEQAHDALDRLIRSAAKDAVLQGQPVALTVSADTAGPDGGSAAVGTIVELVFYGRRSRAGRAAVTFRTAAEGETPTAGAAEAHAVAVAMADDPAAVTSKAARVLLGTKDRVAFEEAFEALLATAPDQASTEALRHAARPAGVPAKDDLATARRIVAVRTLKALGGARVYPEAFAALREDPDEQVADAAK